PCRPHETELSADGPGLEVIVADVLNQGGLIRFARRTANGKLLEADRPRSARPDGLCPGAVMRLRPSRVFVFPEAPAA
ncbi:MAG TPA: TOBE domain-containing protein, partial [Caulobacteraceae bacterium]